MGEEIALIPSPQIFPKIQTALTATSPADRNAGGNVRFMSFPASIKTGTARTAFNPA